MFIEESLWIRQALTDSPLRTGSQVLDIGSSSYEYRTRVQGHIATNIHGPLLERGCAITYVDKKRDSGIDIAADLSKPTLPAALSGRHYEAILCCNILEHVPDRDALICNMVRLARVGGLLVITVPHLYPRHEDPIDTMYRPDIASLVDLVSRYAEVSVRKAEVIPITDRGYYVRERGRLLDYVLPLRTNKLWRYYLKPFRRKVTCAVLEITAVRSSR